MILLLFTFLDVKAELHHGHFILPDTVKKVIDTLKVAVDTIKKEKAFVLEAPINYSAKDSISFDLKQRKAFLYDEGVLKYQDIELKANYTELDFNKSTLKAFGTKDTSKVVKGIPDFKQGTQSFKSDTIRYNFTSKKGYIQNVTTQEGEGFLTGKIVKKMDDGVTDIGNGWYTTCSDLEHPHFAIKYSRAKVIPDKKIITGPAYIELEDIPLPIGIPFGIFPNTKGRASGIVMPTYGESASQGFYLNGLGYYLGLSDNFDMTIRSSIYTRGSWALNPSVNYIKRYKYTGSFSFSYDHNVFGVKGTPDYQVRKDFRITWSHSQDSKARPFGRFSASVNAGSATYSSFNPTSASEYLNNSLSSSVSYSTTFGQTANLSISARHSQNNSNRSISLSLPELSFSVNRIYPFKKKKMIGIPKWYQEINMTYNMELRNELNTYDSLLFSKNALSKLNSGVIHRIPISSSIKLLKYISWNNSANYTERWYPKTIRARWMNQVINGQDTIAGHLTYDTISGFRAARDYSFSSSLSTTIYGMKLFKKGAITGIRHVVTPSVGFSYVPDFGRTTLGYYQYVQSDAFGNKMLYSIFGGMGTPYSTVFGSPPSAKSGSISFSLGNNLEMKVKSKKDTATGEKKVMLIDYFGLNFSYDMARDSLNWSMVNLSGRTTLFKKVQLNYSGSYDPYAVNSKGQSINKFEWQVNHKLLRFTNAAWNWGLSYQLGPKGSKQEKKPVAGTAPPVVKNDATPEAQQINANPDQFMDWKNQWSLSFNYNFRYNSLPDPFSQKRNRTILQTFDCNGSLNLTDKWKVTFQTGYDFKTNKLTYSSFSIYRDLHCWEMRLNWIPYGYLKSWDFTINIKSSLLQDLKLTKRKDFRDNF